MFYCLFTCIGYNKKFLVLWGMEPRNFRLCALMLFWALSYRELCYELSRLVHSGQVPLHPAWVNNIKCLIWVNRTRKMANISVYFSLENLSYSIYSQTLLMLLMLAVCTNKPSNDLVHQSLCDLVVMRQRAESECLRFDSSRRLLSFSVSCPWQDKKKKHLSPQFISRCQSAQKVGRRPRLTNFRA